MKVVWMGKDKKQRTIEFPIILTNEDKIDVKLFQEGKEIVKFSLNYRALINDKWFVVYRIDSYHKFLHEQKFWISDKPISIPRTSYIITGEEVNWLLKKTFENYKHYRSLFETSFNEGGKYGKRE
jgi:hypothetical protein